ncbi:MAG: chromate transporter [Verrucomicrobia bacterium]|nr:chromate transporter [Verrucomicrobiota bacterium]
MNPLLFFWIFLKASLFSTGGLGNLPFLQKDLTAHGWAKNSDFATAIAVGQVSPGPTGLWSISLGYLTFGWLGALLALAALSLPPLLALVVSAFYSRIEKNPAVQDFNRGLGLGVVGLTLAVAVRLAGSLIHTWAGAATAIAALAMALSGRIPVILILVLSAAAGCLQ